MPKTDSALTPVAQAVDAFDEDIKWQNVSAGFGDQWDFEIDGPLIGNYLGSVETGVPDGNSPDPTATRKSWVHQFAPISDPDSVVFAWGSYNLDAAFRGWDTDGNALIPLGTLVRIVWRGKKEMKGKGGKTVNVYTVQVAGQ